MRQLKKWMGSFLWLFIVLVLLNGNIFGRMFQSSGGTVERDWNMYTRNYQVSVKVNDDHSYEVHEVIDVDFTQDRHGIFRYVPTRGTAQTYNQDGVIQKVPYEAKVEMLNTNTTVHTSQENGNQVFKFGDGDVSVSEGVYDFTYKVTPRFQQAAYGYVYYNLFPMQWQNVIPVGSSFRLELPKKINPDQVKLYYGKYGEQKDASELMDVTVNLESEPYVVEGVLKSAMPFGEGLTFTADVGNDYFTTIHQVTEIPWMILIPSGIVLLLVLLLFLLFGRDEQIIPSIQYTPPEGLDSACVGYIIDGEVQNEDLLSLIIYWADKGLLRIAEEKKNKLTLFKLKELPENAKEYEKTMFRGLFHTGDSVKIEDLKYHFTDYLETSSSQLKAYFEQEKHNSIYTKSSKLARGFSKVLSVLPLGIFMFVTDFYSYTSIPTIVLHVVCLLGVLCGTLLFCNAIDRWYGRSRADRMRKGILGLGICVIFIAAYIGSYIDRVQQKDIFNYIPIGIFVTVSTLVIIIATGFMKKRTKECVEWMGHLSGLRDFIETAELDRYRMLAKEDPQMFYHIMPYVYVFGLSDVFAGKLKELSIPAPEWYTTDRQFSFFDFYLFHTCFMGNMHYMSENLTIPEPVSVSSGSSGGFGGGGFGGGGGFSGGGFGGGGGGSW